MLGEHVSGAEELGQLVGDRIDAVAELADEVAVGVIVEVADEMGRECGVVEDAPRVCPGCSRPWIGRFVTVVTSPSGD